MRIAVAAGLAVAAVGVWLWINSTQPSVAPAAAPTTGVHPGAAEPATPAAVVTASPSPKPPGPTVVRVESAAIPGMPLARTTPGPSPSPKPIAGGAAATSEGAVELRAAGELVQIMLRDYRTRMGENPVGSNAEIMKAIMGGNPVGAVLGPPEGQKLNEKGELVDQWGNPYFFHQMSKDKMEVRSAGPDGVMWSPDDILTR